MKNILFPLIFSICFTCNGQMKPSTGVIKHYEKFQSEFVAARNVDVWLPDEYSEDEKFAVLYMHDGQMLFDAQTTWNKQEWQADETADQLITHGKTQKFIIVGIESIAALRRTDYFPQKPFESLPKKTIDSLYEISASINQPMFDSKVNSDNYLKFIVTELKPFIDKNFSVKTGRDHTFIAGSSMAD